MANPIAQTMNPMSAMMGPDVTRQQYELAQNQRYADILMQQALQEQPQGQVRLVGTGSCTAGPHPM